MSALISLLAAAVPATVLPTAASPAQSSTPQVRYLVGAPDGLQDPLSMASIPGDPRLFIVEREGQVRILENEAVLPAPFLDFPAPLALTVSTGLRAIAFHPDYDVNGYVYCWADVPSTSGAIVDVVLSRLQRSAGDPNLVDPATYVEVLRAPQANYGHACGSLEFGPDGYLYALLGDGGNPGDPACNSQNTSSLMGSLMRVDVDGGSPYAIPPDNPFVGDPAVRDEIWHLGFRHPWKWSFDSATGDLWIADVGQAAREEVDFAAAGVGGLNFGWKVMEGSLCFNSANCPAGTPPCFDSGYTGPLYEYDHSVGCSITGGYVYRGGEMADLWGTYFFADYCSGRFWSFRRSAAGQVTEFTERTSQFQPGGGRLLTAPVSFGQDGMGELYVLDYVDKELYRIERQSGVVRYCVGAPNAAGTQGLANSAGSTSVGAADLVLGATGLPPNTFGLFFYGPGVAQIPAGNGFRCIDGSLRRLPVASADAAGRITSPLDFGTAPLGSGPGQVTAGSTWAFQCWYRDVGGPLGQVYNFTDGLSVQFTP